MANIVCIALDSTYRLDPILATSSGVVVEDRTCHRSPLALRDSAQMNYDSCLDFERSTLFSEHEWMSWYCDGETGTRSMSWSNSKLRWVSIALCCLSLCTRQTETKPLMKRLWSRWWWALLHKEHLNSLSLRPTRFPNSYSIVIAQLQEGLAGFDLI